MRPPRARCQPSSGRDFSDSVIASSRTKHRVRAPQRKLPVPPLSLRPESFDPPSPRLWRTYPFGGPPLPFGDGGRFPERPERAVLLPERFRGGCSFGGGVAATLSRAPTAANRRDPTALEFQSSRVNASRLPAKPDDAFLARRVVAQLVRVELEAEQHLEAGAIDRGANRRIGHRIDGRIGVSRPPLAGDLATNVLGQGRGGPKHLAGSGRAGAGADLAFGEVEADLAVPLGDDVGTALHDADEIGQNDVPGALPVAAARLDVEGDLGVDELTGVVAGAAHVGDLRNDVDRGRIAAGRRVEYGDVPSRRRDGDRRAGRVTGQDAGLHD